jgi:hypothetical protein
MIVSAKLRFSTDSINAIIGNEDSKYFTISTAHSLNSYL